jgi:acyl-CoA synthetase (AMP-forming)/AMP-acid ligase II
MTDQPSDGCSPLFTSDIGPDSLRIPTGFDDTLVGHLARASHLVPDAPAFTFVDYSTDFAGRRETVTWAELDRRVETLAQALAQAGATGQRVAVVAPQGLEYVIGFLGALRAGAIAVPLFSPHMPGHEERLVSALRDAGPVCLLTTRRARTAVADFCTSRRLPGANRVLAIGGPYLAGLPQTGIDESESVRPRPEDCAYLQYASGSTRSPAGVEITHANAVANVRQALKAFEIDRDRNQIVSWLPLFHDMGLVLAIAIPVVGAVHSVITDPLAFVQHPARWLRLLADHPRAVTAAPNFAYDYCVRRVHESARDGLRLDHVSVMINGSEPVRPGTLSRFEQAFASTGLSPTAVRPSYGLAEATVLVSTSQAGQLPRVTAFDRESLRQGTLRSVSGTAAGNTSELVSCGEPVGQELVIVATDTGRSLPDSAVGEIWVRGPNVGRGYWRNPLRSTETFAAVPAGTPSDDEETGGWLRTGDLGALHDGCLYVTGRIKDLIIIDGTNHYPQDIEVTVQEAHEMIRHDHVAAFSLTISGEERLVVVAEHSRRLTDPRVVRDAVARAVRGAVAMGHGTALHDFVLARPGTVPRTSSGKVARTACRARYLAGVWASSIEADLTGAGEGE